MKKLLSLVLAIALFVCAMPLGTLAFDPYEVHLGQSGCQLTTLSFTQSDNPWLMWDVTFQTEMDGRVWETTKDHPNILGQSLIPTFTAEGDYVTFNGTTIESGVTAVTVNAENELIVYNGSVYAEYQITVTETNNGLPVVLINTNGVAIPDKVNYVDSTISVIGSDVYGGEDIYAAVAGIKLRGNSTMGYDKKPYRIKFDSKQNVFGLGKAKSWVLLANYLDPAAMRNEIAYKFGTSLAKMTEEATGFVQYVPRMRAVEVYLNGTLLGLYDMGDHVQVDGTRIDIDESGDDGVTDANVGYYLEVEDSSRVLAEYESEGAPYFTISNTGGYSTDTLYVQFKTPEAPSEEQRTYITNYLQTINDLIRAEDPAVWDYIDMNGFIDWYLCNELFKNTDSGFLSSVKMTKDKDGKLYMGPIWDFDLSSGVVSYVGEEPTGWRTRVDEKCDWYIHLFNMDDFVAAVEQRWEDLHTNGIFDELITNIDSQAELIEDAAHVNYALWQDNYVNAVNATGWLTVPDYVLNAEHWEQQVQYFRAYMQARIAWIDEQFHYSVSSNTLSGKPAILGMAQYSYTLTASPMSIVPYGATVSYQWYADGVAISGATSSTFTPGSAYLGKALTVTATGTGSYRGSVTSDPVVFEKTDNSYQTSQIPQLISKTHDTLVILERTGYEISIDGVNWQTSGTFTGLTPNTLYRVQYRHGEFSTEKCGVAGNALYVITDVDPDKPVTVLKGDAQLDGDVDTSDVKLVLMHAMTTDPLTGDALDAADYNSDGTVNTTDAREILVAIASGEFN